MPFLKSSASTYQEKGRIRTNLFIIFLVAFALIVSAIFVLPNLATDVDVPEVKISSIDFDGNVISLNAELSQVYVKVLYSDGSSKQVALSEMVTEGLDTEKEGEQDVVLNFGGFIQNIKISVVSTECQLNYFASTGGRVLGETIQTVPAGGNATTVVAVPDVGYRFVKWNDGYPYETRQDKRVSVSNDITASFEKIKYTVIFFYPDGTTARESLVSYNEAAIAPDITISQMQKYGYKFVKWSEDFSKITKESKIYPIYEKFATDIDFSITLGVDNKPLGTAPNLKPFYTKGVNATITVEPNVYRKFESWSILNYKKEWVRIAPNMQGGETVEITPGQLILFKSGLAEGSLEAEGKYSLNFVPKETIDKVSIRANFVYAESELVFRSFETIERAITLPLGVPIGIDNLLPPKDVVGYEFKHWYVKNGPIVNGEPVKIEPTDVFERPTEIIALWQKKVQKVIFLPGHTSNNEIFTSHPNYDADLKGIVLEVYFQDSLTTAINGSFPQFIPEKNLYDFTGWYLSDENGETATIVIDANYRVISERTYIVPKYEVKKRVVTINYEGAGEISYGEINSSKNIINTFKFPIDADKSYEFEAKASSGYMLDSIEWSIGGISNSTVNNNFTINRLLDLATNITEISINIAFVTREYNLTINNGNSVVRGTIYDDGLLVDFGMSSSITIVILHNVSKHIGITAPDGYYIEKVLVNNNSIVVPDKTINFTLPLENIIIDTQIDIFYGKFEFEIEVPKETLNGNISIESGTGENGSYSSTDKPKVEVKAEEGFFIKYFLINGIMVDPYTFVEDYDILAYDVNGVTQNPYRRSSIFGKDNRFTAIQLRLNGIMSNKNMEVVFGEIYYFVNVETDSSTTVANNRIQVSYKQNLDIVAYTETNRYIYSYEIDGVVFTFSDSLNSQTITIPLIQEDKTIKIVTNSFKKIITFIGDRVEYSYKDINGETINNEFNTTQSRDIGSDNNFIITADKGYHLSSITISKIVNGQTVVERVDLPYNSSVYNLSVNALKEDVKIKVETEINTYNIMVYLSNGEGCDYEILNGNHNLEYNQSTVIKITVAEGKILNGILVNGKEYTVRYEDNKAIVNIDNIDKNYEIIAKFVDKDVSGDNSIVYSFDNTKGNIFAYKYGDLTKEPITECEEGDKIVYKVELNDNRYQLKFFSVNNQSNFTFDQNNEVVVEVTSKQYVTALFVDAMFAFNVVSVDGAGYVNANKDTIEFQDLNLDIKIIPQNGYYISRVEFIIGNETLILTENDIKNQILNNGYIYKFNSQKIINNINCNVIFSPIEYEMNISIEGNGSITTYQTDAPNSIDYDQEIILNITANDNNFIDRVIINGASYNLANMYESQNNASIQKFVKGKIKFNAVSDYNIEIIFAPNIFRVYVADTPFGTTMVRADGGNYTDGKDLGINAGASLFIHMKGDVGYHIESLEINGVIIHEDIWKEDLSNPNNNKDIRYELKNIDKNINIRVRYTINLYQINFSERNESLNFKSYETDYRQFGSIRVYGYDRIENYAEGISHGSNIRIIISPITSKGYYISKFEIRYVINTELGDQTISQDLTNRINANGGEYIFENVKADNVEIIAEFKRRAYESTAPQIFVDSLGSTFRINHTTNIVYKNPYNPDAEIYTIENKYEYGLQYEVMANPGVGYFVDSFKISSDKLHEGEERKQYIRNNIYKNTIIGDTYIYVYYQINSYEVLINFNTEGGVLEVYDGDILLQTTSDAVITITHNKLLTFVMKPKYETAGYYNSSLSVDGVNILIEELNSLFSTDKTVTKSFEVRARFVINTYKISFVGNLEGGKPTASPDKVQWGKSSVIRISIEEGYYIDKFEINGQVYGKDSLINNAFNLENIKSDTIISFTINKNTYTISYSDGYARNGKTYLQTNNGQKLEQNNNINSIEYKDYLKFYFEPTEGYEVSYILITMKDINGITKTIIDSVGSLSTDINNKDYKFYNINNATGDIVVSVRYTLKSFNVSINVNTGNGSITTNPLASYEYNQRLSFALKANEGYHLKSLNINGIEFIGRIKNNSNSGLSYTINNVDNLYYYEFNEIIKQIHNKQDNIIITIEFEMNAYKVLFYVNEQSTTSGTYDQPLYINLYNNIISQNTTATITQTRSEGYRISGITLFYGNDKNSVGNNMLFNNYLNSSSIDINYAVTDNGSPLYYYLDYHDSEKNYFVFKYTTEIITYTSDMDIRLFEEGEDEYDQNNHSNKFGLEKIYRYPSGSPEGDVEGTYKHFTTATFTVKINDSAKNYEFGGFYEKIDGVWVLAKDGQLGVSITLKNNEFTLIYEIKDNREFNAVIYKVYEVNLYIYPEFKWISGEYQSTNFNLRYKEYAKLEARELSPNVNNKGNEADKFTESTLDNLNIEEDSYGHYIFRLKAKSKLSLKGIDTIQTNYSSDVQFYLVENGIIGSRDHALSSASGKVITKNLDVYAFFQNDIKLSMDIDSVGGRDRNEGGSVKYQDGNNNNLTLNQNSLKVKGNGKVKINIEANNNFRIEGIYVKAVLGKDSNNELILGDWINIDDTSIKYLTVNYSQDNGVNNRAVISIDSVTENIVFKITFIKMITFSAKVECFTDEENQKYENLPQLSDFMTKSGRYDYGSEIVLDALIADEEISKKWQFVGFMINGVNEYRYIMENYVVPNVDDHYRQVYYLSQYSAENNQGIELNGVFNVEIIVKYVPIYDIKVINEYNGLDNEKFDQIGEIFVNTVQYNENSINYDRNSVKVDTKGGEITLPILGKINGSSSNEYDSWKNNMVELRYFSQMTQNGVDTGFRFESWQYYDSAEAKYMDIPSADSNPATSQTFTFALGVLYGKVNAMGEIQIRAKIQKIQSIDISKRILYYSNDEAVLAPEANRNDNRPTVNNVDMLNITMNYGETVTIRDGTWTEDYEFAGWIINGTPTNDKTLTLGLKENYNIVAKYIKKWTITIEVKNISGNTITSDSSPFVRVTESNRIGIGDYLRKETFQFLAGDSFAFALYLPANSKFDAKYDKFKRKVTTSSINGTSIDTTAPTLNSTNYSFETIGENISILFEYETHGELTIRNLIEGSTLIFTKDIAKVMANSESASAWSIVDNSEADEDKTQGVIKIVGLPMRSFSEEIKVSLLGLPGVQISPKSSQVFDFDGNSSNYKRHIDVEYYGNAHISGYIEKPFTGGQGSQSNPFLISNKNQFSSIDMIYLNNGHSVKGIHFKITSGINFANVPTSCIEGNGFDGTLDGDNKMFSGISVNSKGDSFALFDKIYGGTIKNISLRIDGSGLSITGTGREPNYGVISNVANNATFINISIINTTLTVRNGQRNVSLGVLAGKATNTTIDTCESDSTSLVLDSSTDSDSNNGGAGTFAGTFINGKILNSKIKNTTVNIWKRTSGGGFVGVMIGTKDGIGIQKGSIEGGDFNSNNEGGFIGGMVGRLVEGAISNSVIKPGSIKFTSEASGTIFSALGALVGYSGGSLISDIKINDSTSNNLTLLLNRGVNIFGAIAGMNDTDSRIIKAVGTRMQIDHKIPNDNVYIGGLIGRNNGILNESSITMANSGYTQTINSGDYNNTVIKAVFDGGNYSNNDFYRNEGTMVSIQATAVSEQCYGGLVGENTTNGRIGYIGSNEQPNKNTFSGKIMINNRLASKAEVNVYMGGIVGSSINRYATGVVNNSALVNFFLVDVDKAELDSPATIKLKQMAIGTNASNAGALTGNYSSVNAHVEAYAMGKDYTKGVSPTWTGGGADAKNYKVLRISIAQVTNGKNQKLNWHNFNPLDSSNYIEILRWGLYTKRQYTGKWRAIQTI